MITTVLLAPFLTGLWFYAGLITWSALIQVATPEGNPATRDVGWLLDAHLARDRVPVTVPDTLPQWLLDEFAADRQAEAVTAVSGWLCAVLVAVVPGHAPQVIDWAVRPIDRPLAGAADTTGELAVVLA